MSAEDAGMVMSNGVEVDPLTDDCIGLPSIRHGEGQTSVIAPLRKIIESTSDEDILECGHSLVASSDIYGNTYPARRRCVFCAQVASSPVGPITPVEGETT